MARCYRSPILLVGLKYYLFLWIFSSYIGWCYGQQQVTFYIDEELDVGTYIGNVSVRHFGVTPIGNAGAKVNVNTETGIFTVKSSIDRDAPSRDTLIKFFLLVSGGTPITVDIIVNDVNDNAPEFPERYVAISLSEAVTDEYQYSLGTANDPDEGDNSIDRFEIVDGNVGDIFFLDSEIRNGKLYPDLKVRSALDYEQQPMYSLRIRAFDGGSPPLYGDMVVNITLQDVNDNQPIFHPTQYSASIPENVTIGTSVVQVFATDLETGENGRISYGLQGRGKPSDNDFRIIEDTGILVVNRELDYETEQKYELIVVAFDHGVDSLESTAVVTIEIQNINDNAPVINVFYTNTDSPGRISEDIVPPAAVAIISISDADTEVDPEVDVRISGDDDNFYLESTDNVRRLIIREVDREEQQVYQLIITATDTGNPPLSSQKSITLYISDTNDNPPVFRQELYQAEIEETDPIGSSVVQLTAHDNDEGNNSVITYQIRNTPETYSDWFQIDNHTGLITTKRRVDCETQSDPSLQVVAYDSGIPPQSATTTVNVHINNVNDNQPIFEQSFYSVEVPENSQIGNCILTVSATDQDCGQSESITYTLVSPAAAAELSMRVATGQLCISSALDFERKQLYEFEVAATDQDGLHSTANVKVQVSDVNDNYPEFYPAQYDVNLVRGSEAGTPVAVVQATDLDEGHYGEVTYAFHSGNEQGLFAINPQSGAIHLAMHLTNSPDTLDLSVEAIDSGGRESVINAHVRITLIDAAEDLPQFTNPLYSFAVPENASVHTPVGTVQADHAGAVTYSIQSGDQNRLFEIDPTSGQVKVGSSLDHDMIPYVLLNIQAASGQPPVYGQAQVNITIQDVNDNPPVFGADEQEIMVRENHALTTPLYTAHATDLDSGANGLVTYSLLTGGQRFSIDQTGDLVLTSALDYEAEHEHTVRIQAADLGSPQQTAVLLLTVRVQDVNDNDPEFTQSVYNVEVLESVGINTRFATVSASDRDSDQNARIVYSLVPGAHSHTFGIFPNDGSIYNKVLLDRETQNHYSLEVVAEDEGEPSRSTVATVSITVEDTNDNDPQFLEGAYSFYVLENKDAGTDIGQVSATDLDLNEGPLQYAIMPSSNTVRIDSTSGMLSTKGTLDREITEAISVSVRVTDAGTPPRSSSVGVTLHILDENDNSPRFDRNGYSVRVEENEPKNTLVVVVSATDSDKGENATITYALAETNQDYIFNHFQINAQTGQILIADRLNYEVRNHYFIHVIARDSGTFPRQSQTTVNVTVVDRNEASPEFNDTQFSITVLENKPIHTEVGRVVAEDADIYDVIRYYIIGGNQFGTFAVNASTGAIVVGRPVDYEQSSHHTIRIRAIDSSPTNPKSNIINVNITVEDVNDNPPLFEEDPIIVSIRENIPMGTTVHTYSAIDLDSGGRGQVRYEIVSQSPNATTWFRIEENTGALISIAEIDYEEVTQISLVVRATDKPVDRAEELHTTVTTLVMVENKNDNAPVFTSDDRVYVMEDEPVGYPLMNVIATDLDAGREGDVNYIIVLGNEMGHFHIDFHSGLLTIAKTLDRETTDLYELRISARDNGSPREETFLVFSVYIVDVNDNRPSFDHPVYSAEVHENEQLNTTLITLTATDRDIGNHAELIYLIPDGIVDGKFSIDNRTGEIRTNAALDREEQEVYTLTAYVRDSAFPALYDTATVTITVLDRNDNAPVFSEETYALRVHENTALPALYTVIASDADAGRNGEVRYSIIGGNSESRFSIDQASGQISCEQLDRETTAYYNLSIEAHDRGATPARSTMMLYIEVLDENDHDPVFEEESYSARLSEAVSAGSPVLTVRATDADSGINALLTYSITSTQGVPFRVDNVTGQITTTGVLDRERLDNYTFDVLATDGGVYGPRHNTVTVHVTLDDVNDNAPVFEQIPYTKTIEQNTQQGSSILTISAADADVGSNGAVVYSLETSTAYFSLHGQSGVLSVARPLDSAAVRVHLLEVRATDAGQPALSTNGVVEVTVGSGGGGSSFRFTHETYSANMSENSAAGDDVIAVTTTGRSDVTYSFVSDNNDDAFTIDRFQGHITVNDPSALDYEVTSRMRLIVEATSGQDKAYVTVYVNLEDYNDNPPVFTQDRYVISVYEAQVGGTFVTQLMATDLDSGNNGRVFYEILNPGDIENAFMFDGPQTGIIMTNRILDVEYQQDYKLIIGAFDRGMPMQSSTCTVKIQVIDVNDNEPYFRTHPPVPIDERVPLGWEVTTVVATDTDVNHFLNYYFDENGNPGNMFSIDAYSGKITVARQLDYEEQNKYDLIVKVSDMEHVAAMELQVNVQDINDNLPVFTQSSFQIEVDEETGPGVSILTVTATDRDDGENARITYSMIAVRGFYIDAETGTIYTNSTVRYNRDQPVVNLVVTARDHGSPPYTAVVPVQVTVRDINNNRPRFQQNTYTGSVSEDEMEGLIIVYTEATDDDYDNDNRKIDYSILAGNTNNTFQIQNENGAVYLVGPLDREIMHEYRLTVQAKDRGDPPLSSTATVVITVEDVNDNAPDFVSDVYYTEVPENTSPNEGLLRVEAMDSDSGMNGRVKYDITSGNDYHNFEINRDSGLISVSRDLDHETRSQHSLIVSACDLSFDSPRQTSYATVRINVTDVNEYEPTFPVLMYFESVLENQPIGTSVFTAEASDLDGGIYGIIAYELENADGNFDINHVTGVVTTLRQFSRLEDERFEFKLKAVDREGQFSRVPVMVKVEPSFKPVFSEPEYNFAVRGDAEVGEVIGQVVVNNPDSAPSGVALVEFELKYPHEYLAIGALSGEIRVIRDLQSDSTEQRRRKREIRLRRALEDDTVTLVVVAKVGYPPQTSEVVINIDVDHNCAGCETKKSSGESSSGIGGTYIVIIVVFVVIAVVLGIIILALFVRGRTQRKAKHDSRFNSFNTVESVTGAGGPNGYGPPSYADAQLYAPHGMTDSSSPGAGSSGRGSVDMEEDEEIRMINATPLHSQDARGAPPDSGMMDDDAMSEHSAKDHHEYLARLGIDTSKLKMNENKTQSVESMHQFSDEGGGEGDGLDTFQYSAMRQESMASLEQGEPQFGFQEPASQSTGGSLSSVINSEEEFSGSYNWDYLLDWGPQYQPLADVFTEIARLKDDSIKPKKAPTKIVPQLNSGFINQQQLRTSFPPPIITDAPPKAIELSGPNGQFSSHAKPHHPRERKDSSSSNLTVNSTRTSQLTSLSNLPKSPMSYESSFTTTPLSPDFENSLSPLQQHSPTFSPIVTPGVGSTTHSTGHNTPRGHHHNPHRAPGSSSQGNQSSGSEQEIHI